MSLNATVLARPCGALRGQAPGYEGEGQLRSPVKPLRVVDDADQRLFPRRLRQEGQHRQTDQELIGSVPAPQAERAPQRVGLRAG